MTELAAPQISSLMEALPGIAAVLRSPVATAMVDLSRAAAGIGDFKVADAEELLRFGVRRNLLDEGEIERVLAELRTAGDRKVPRSAREEKAAAGAKAKAAAALAPKPSGVKPIVVGKADPNRKPPAAPTPPRPAAKKAAPAAAPVKARKVAAPARPKVTAKKATVAPKVKVAAKKKAAPAPRAKKSVATSKPAPKKPAPRKPTPRKAAAKKSAAKKK